MIEIIKPGSCYRVFKVLAPELHSIANSQERESFLYIKLIKYIKSFFVNKKHIKEFERDFPVFLISLTSTIRAGIDPFCAIEKTEKLFSENSVIASEISYIIQSYKSEEITELQAIDRFGSKVYADREFVSPEVQLFKSAFKSSYSEGSTLAPSLYRIASITRRRTSFKRKVKTALIVQKATGIGICIATILILTVQYIANPESILLAINSKTGLIALSVGSLLIFIGTIQLIRLSNKDLLS